jgi:hypothetical protein
LTTPCKAIRTWRFYEYMALHTEEAVPKEAMLKAFEELECTYADEPEFLEQKRLILNNVIQ